MNVGSPGGARLLAVRPACAFLDTPLPHAFAHRGGAVEGLDNAVSQFTAVQRLGYRYVESDVRTTADGVALVFHDEDAGRLTGQSVRIGDLSYRQVQSLVLREGEPIARLDEVLHAFPGLRFNLDLKDEAAVRSVPPVLRRTAALSRVCITSFSQARIRRVRPLLGPDVCTGLGVGGVTRLVAHALTGTRRGQRAGGAAVLQLPWALPGGRHLPVRLVELGHREGLAVHVWTLDDRASIGAALDAGVDGIMTDDPVLLKTELERRGLWS